MKRHLLVAYGIALLPFLLASGCSCTPPKNAKTKADAAAKETAQEKESSPRPADTATKDHQSPPKSDANKTAHQERDSGEVSPSSPVKGETSGSVGQTGPPSFGNSNGFDAGSPNTSSTGVTGTSSTKGGTSSGTTLAPAEALRLAKSDFANAKKAEKKGDHVEAFQTAVAGWNKVRVLENDKECRELAKELASFMESLDAHLGGGSSQIRTSGKPLSVE